MLGTYFVVNPLFDDAIDDRVNEIRAEIAAHRQSNQLIAYISTPISSRGGGYTAVNVEIAASVKEHIEKRFGSGLWAVTPGQSTYVLPEVDGVKAEGGDYMFMWTAVLAGTDGAGSDFDLVYFVGPDDVGRYFGDNGTDRIGLIDAFVDQRAMNDDAFRSAVAENPQARKAFIRFYALRASTAYSLGAHDEWNIFRLVNRRRGIAEQVSVYFDGQAASPGEMEHAVVVGYESTARPQPPADSHSHR